MREFIDKSSIDEGTPLNRDTMLAIQGFDDTVTTFNNDGSITEVNGKSETKLTEFNNDGSITETFTGEKTIIKTTTFTGNVISEVIS